MWSQIILNENFVKTRSCWAVDLNYLLYVYPSLLHWGLQIFENYKRKIIFWGENSLMLNWVNVKEFCWNFWGVKIGMKLTGWRCCHSVDRRWCLLWYWSLHRCRSNWRMSRCPIRLKKVLNFNRKIWRETFWNFTSKYSAKWLQASSSWFSSKITSNISGGHWLSFSAATIWTDKFFAWAFPRDLINLCKTWKNLRDATWTWWKYFYYSLYC